MIKIKQEMFMNGSFNKFVNKKYSILAMHFTNHSHYCDNLTSEHSFKTSSQIKKIEDTE